MVILEVLSPSTYRNDIGEKYQDLNDVIPLPEMESELPLSNLCAGIRFADDE
ncbi:MAG: hypothetical protein ACJAQT_001265 [Akkermansiaceae bacterium]